MNNATYTYDVQDAQVPRAHGCARAANHLGQRSSKTTVINSVSTTTYYIYDPQGHLIGEYEVVIENSEQVLKPVREYIWLEGQLLAQYDYATSATEPKMNYYINDHLGTPVFMTDRNPQQTYELTTGPFGERFGEFKAANTTQNIRFPGQYWDEETGYSYNNQRYYDPAFGYIQPDKLDVLGRANDPELWMAEDMGAIELPDETDFNSLYQYANQNSVNKVDSDGLYPGVSLPSVNAPILAGSGANGSATHGHENPLGLSCREICTATVVGNGARNLATTVAQMLFPGSMAASAARSIGRQARNGKNIYNYGECMKECQDRECNKKGGDGL